MVTCWFHGIGHGVLWHPETVRRAILNSEPAIRTQTHKKTLDKSRANHQLLREAHHNLRNESCLPQLYAVASQSAVHGLFRPAYGQFQLANDQFRLVYDQFRLAYDQFRLAARPFGHQPPRALNSTDQIWAATSSSMCLWKFRLLSTLLYTQCIPSTEQFLQITAGFYTDEFCFFFFLLILCGRGSWNALLSACYFCTCEKLLSTATRPWLHSSLPFLVGC